MKKGLAILIVSLVVLSGCQNQKVTDSSVSKDNSSEAVSVSESEKLSQEEISEPITETASSSETAEKPKVEDTAVSEAVPQTAEIPLDSEELCWWQNGLQKDKIIYKTDEPSCGNPISNFLFYDDVRKISYTHMGTVFLKEEDFDKYNELELLSSAKETDDLGERILKDNFFEIITLNDTKYTIVFYEKGIELSEYSSKMGNVPSVKLSIDKDDYALILKNIKKRVDEIIEISEKPCGCV